MALAASRRRRGSGGMKTEAPQAQLRVLQARFAAHPWRHPDLDWAEVAHRLYGHASALRTLAAMEASGGEPDVIGCDGVHGQVLFCDCSPESPTGRRSLCYDRQALDARKAHKPAGSAVEAAAAMGVALLDEPQYHALQRLGEFDLATSSWVATPDAIRSLGGALFCDRRFGRVFTYHNGAQSYYAARGFRGLLRV